MERIQIAIAKARAARDQREGLDQVPGAAEPQSAPELQATKLSGLEPGPIAPVLAVPSRPAPQTEEKAVSSDSNATTLSAAVHGASPSPMLDLMQIDTVWSRIPEMKIRSRLLARHRVVAAEGGAGAAEVDGIRTRLLHMLATKGWRRVAITSPGPACGKTTLAANLGFSLGRQRDQRTLVIELDLRRPAMARALGLHDRHEVAKVLEGDSFFVDNAVRHGRNLAFATNYKSVRNSAELLQSRRAGEALARIEAEYQPTVVIFDLPPLLASDDAMAFLPKVDCALMVASAEVTTIKEIDRCERELASRTNVLGVVLNRCRYMSRGDSYSDYGYNKG